MSEPNDNITETTVKPPETSTEKTFTQTEVDSILGKRLAKAMKGMPGEEELTAFRAWKESQKTEKDRLDNLTRESDENKKAGLMSFGRMVTMQSSVKDGKKLLVRLWSIWDNERKIVWQK